MCAQTVQLESCHTPTRRKDCKASERTACSLYRTAADAAVLCACVCSNRRFPSHGFADRFRCHTHRGAVSSSTRSRDQRRDAASLSEEEEEGEELPERLCGTLANLSPPPLLLFLCQGQPPTNVGVECLFSVLKGEEKWHGTLLEGGGETVAEPPAGN